MLVVSTQLNHIFLPDWINSPSRDEHKRIFETTTNKMVLKLQVGWNHPRQTHFFAAIHADLSFHPLAIVVGAHRAFFFLSFNTGAVFGWIRTPESRRRKHLDGRRRRNGGATGPRVLGIKLLFKGPGFCGLKKGNLGRIFVGVAIFGGILCALIVDGVLWMVLGIDFF